MNTQKDSLHGFCILQLIYKENQTEQTVFQNQTETEPNRGFLKTETELEKSILHIPSPKANPFQKFRKNSSIGFWVILLRDRQTNRQTET